MANKRTPRQKKADRRAKRTAATVETKPVANTATPFTGLTIGRPVRRRKYGGTSGLKIQKPSNKRSRAATKLNKRTSYS